MSSPEIASSRNRLHTIAVVLASLIIPAPIITGKIVETIMDTSNPAGLEDLNAPLAYLGEILVSSFTVLGIVLVLLLITTIMLWLRNRSWASISLPVTVAIIQVVVGVITLILDQVISAAAGG